MILLTNEQEIESGFGTLTISVSVGSSNPQLQFNSGDGWENHKGEAFTASEVFTLPMCRGIKWRFTNMGDSTVRYSLSCQPVIA